jgi:outer membrane protein OmpA-like peptidoglycan-associated protein
VGTPRWRALASLAWTAPAEAPAPPPVRDTDGDGIVDSRDACPEVAGQPDADPARNGCPHPPPDRDRDGVPDARDACPEVAGLASSDPHLNGCPPPLPDRDGDGVPDVDDACPGVRGLMTGDPKTNGCPPPDRDGDGVPDATDECPDTPGNPGLGGCPGADRDADGVPDRLDNCPAEAGPAANQGCPADRPQVVALARERLVLRQPIAFEAKTARLESRSQVVLEQLAQVLKAHPELVSVTIEGHADDRPLAEDNLTLSRERAAAVVHELVRRGVARTRLESRAYGASQPLVSADGSAEAHAANARIEVRFFAVMR